MKRFLWVGTIVALVAAMSFPAFTQESAVKGSLAGTVLDATGAVIPGAKVTVTGPTGAKVEETNDRGEFTAPLLVPGFYSVKVEKQGFKGSDVRNVEVFTGRTSNIRVSLQPGAVAEVVEVTASAVTVDTTSTATSANLSDTFYSQIPVQRNVTGLFMASAGVAGGGQPLVAGNPSISGGSALENQYVADGVNITDGGFGGIGVFSRVYGSLSTGINLSFVKEVQVKTSGFEPQYGKTGGGVVQIVTKSGSRDFHGAVAAYLQPSAFEKTRLHAEDFNLFNALGRVNHQYAYDLSGEVGGYVPGLRDKLFFFGSFNPSWTRDELAFTNLHGIIPTPGSTFRAPTTNETTTYNYAGKLTFNVTPKHTLEGSIFGDPARTPFQSNGDLTSVINDTADDELRFGTRNLVGRWNATLTPTWLVNASVSWGHNYLTDTPKFPNVTQIQNLTARDPRPGLNCAAAGNCTTTGLYNHQGFGFLENTTGNTIGFSVDTSKIFNLGGEHSFNLGYRLDKSSYDGSRERSGPRYAIPRFDMAGTDLVLSGDLPASVVGLQQDAALQLRRAGSAASGCTLCPTMTVPGLGPSDVYLLQTRGEFSPPTFDTDGVYHSIYVNDTWSPWKYLTFNLGLRWEQQMLQGSLAKYTFTGNWSPRVGVSVDPWGDRRTKVYTNFGRYNYAIPLDLAIRSLSGESSVLLFTWAPPFDAAGNVAFNADGTITPVFDAAHLLPPGMAQGFIPSLTLASSTAIAPGTKMQYVDEWVVGFERDFGHGVIFSARYIDRRMKRAVEDIAGISPEAFNAGAHQIYFITNPTPNTDLFVNPIQIGYDSPGPAPAGCQNAAGVATLDLGQVTNSNGDIVTNAAGNDSVCIAPQFGLGGVANYVRGAEPGDQGGDGNLDGFVQPVRNYQAMEFEVNKSFSQNWQLRANWRIAKLKGNYEGAFRNDNGQTDPSISSLFDFVRGDFDLLGDQFSPGYLNTDRRHIVNAFFSYVFDRTALKGLTLGSGVRVETGPPISALDAHPSYANAGEIPRGGRGALGRLPTTGSVDLHADYSFKVTESTRLRFGMDLFNVSNMRRATRVDERTQRTVGVPNADFQKPRGNLGAFQRPFYARALIRLEF